MSKVSNKNKRIETFAIVNKNAAGIDISDKEHVVAVSAECCHDNVRTFASFTCDLEQIATWLKLCSVNTIAMESTGVYWIPLFLLLQEHGFEVCLVNAKHVKNVTGKKNDMSDAAWIQKLHSCGLLSASFQPDELTRSMRSTMRHRKSLTRDAARYLNRIQKALELMNIKIHTVISDIAGKTGQLIVQAIIRGERDAKKLAILADPRIKASEQEIIKSLQGYWREENLFELKQCYEMYLILHTKIKECDQIIEVQLQKMIARANEGELPDIDMKIERARSKSNPAFNTKAYLKTLYGIDLTEILGISELSALQILSECGTDMNKWPTDKHFSSWLALAPNTKISGGKIISNKILKKKHIAGQTFRMAASTLHNSKSPLGDFYRKIKSKSGPGSAVVATARKLAVIYYHMIKDKHTFDLSALLKAQQIAKEKKIKRLEKQLQKLKAA